MEEKEMISYFAHEGMMARMERMNHRLWVVIIILIVALITTNLAWILYEAQWEVYEETTTQEVTQDSGDGGENTFVGGDYNGSTSNKDYKNNPR